MLSNEVLLFAVVSMNALLLICVKNECANCPFFQLYLYSLIVPVLLSAIEC